MQRELGLSTEQWGWVLGSFILSYGLFEIPTGAWGDRSGRHAVLTRIVLWWSGFTILTALTSSFWPLLAVRFLFGAGEAGAYPNMAGVVAEEMPEKRATAMGFIWGASRSGGALASLLVVPLQAAFGWRASFFLFGAIGIVWAAVWWFSAKPVRQPAASKIITPWAQLLGAPRLWTIMLMYGCYAWASWFYFTWLPTWLVKGRGFSESEMSLFAALPFVLGMLGNLAGGVLGDVAVRRFGLRHGRAVVGSSCLLAAAALLVATALTRDRQVAVVLLSLGFGVLDLMLPSAWALCLDISGAHAGAVSGAMNTAGQFGGFLCTVLFGYLVSRFDNYDLPLFVIAGMVTLSAFLFTRIDASRPLLQEVR